jgi:hypothetical protein
MPYCTIEEAWDVPINPDISNFPKPEIQSIKDDVPLKVLKAKQTNYSRTYNRQNEHSGPTTRLPSNKQQLYIRSNPKNKLDNPENHPNDMNDELPIGEYNLNMYQTLNDEYVDKHSKKDIESRNEKFSTITNDEGINKIPNSQYIDIIRQLQKENTKLKELINDFKNNGQNDDKDSLFDLIVFLSSGILLILMMENITKLIRKF